MLEKRPLVALDASRSRSLRETARLMSSNSLFGDPVRADDVPFSGARASCHIQGF